MKDAFQKLVFLAAILSVIIVSCEKPDVKDDQNLVEKLYSSSKDTISIDSHNYFLKTYLSRDFMPGGPIPTKSKLAASIYLVNYDSMKISNNITITKLFVINGSLIWTSIPHDPNDPYVPEYKLVRVSTDGPEWETDIFVNVIAEIHNSLTDKIDYIIARNQKIEATY
jgi:hypothetical protein